MFDSLISPIERLSKVMANLEEVTAFTSDTVVTTLERIEEAIHQFTAGLVVFATKGGDIGYYLDILSIAWERWYKDIEDTIPVLKNAVDTFSTLTSSILSLTSGFASLKDATELTFKDFDDGMKKITRTIPRFTHALEINMGNIVMVLEDLDAVWSKYAEDMEDIIPSASGATNAFTKLTSSVLALGDAFTKLMEFGVTSEADFDTGLQNLMRTFDNFAASLDKNIEALMASLHGLVTEWLENEDQMVYLMRAFVTIAGNFITVIGYALQLANAFDALKGKTDIIKGGIDDLIGVIDHLIGGLAGIYSTDVAGNLVSFTTDIANIIGSLTDLKTTLNVDVTTAFGNLSTIIEDASGRAITAINAIGVAVGSLLSTIREAANAISDGFRNAVSGVESIMASLAGSAYGWGHSLMYSFIEGIYSEMDALEAAMQTAAGIVDSYMGVSSPTEKGALAELEAWGPNLVRTFTEGIKGELPGLNSVLRDMSLGGVSLSGVASGGGNSSNNTTIYMTNNIQNRADADHVINEVTRLMRKPVIV